MDSLHTKDGWLTAKGVRYFFIFLLVFAIMGALSSCNKAEPVYYLYVTDYDEESISVEIRECIGNKETIVCVLDRYVDSHSQPETIIEALDTQIGFSSSYAASVAYWNIIE